MSILAHNTRAMTSVAHVHRLAQSIRISSRALESSPTFEAAQECLDRIRAEFFALDETLGSIEGVVGKGIAGENARRREPAASEGLDVPVEITSVDAFDIEAERHIRVLEEIACRPLFPIRQTTGVVTDFAQAFEEATRA